MCQSFFRVDAYECRSCNKKQKTKHRSEQRHGRSALVSKDLEAKSPGEK